MHISHIHTHTHARTHCLLLTSQPHTVWVINMDFFFSPFEILDLLYFAVRCSGSPGFMAEVPLALIPLCISHTGLLRVIKMPRRSS